MKTFTPQNWPASAPKFDSPEGWEYQKMLARKQAKTEASTLPYMLMQAEQAHKAQNYRREMLFLTIALRLAEAVEYEYTALIAAMIVTVSAVCDAMDDMHRPVGNYEIRTRRGAGPKMQNMPDLSTGLYNN